MHLDEVTRRAAHVFHRDARIDDFTHLVIRLDDVAHHGGAVLDDVTLLVNEHIALIHVTGRATLDKLQGDGRTVGLVDIGGREKALFGKDLDAQGHDAFTILGGEPLALDILHVAHELANAGLIFTHLVLHVAVGGETDLIDAIVNLLDGIVHLDEVTRRAAHVFHRDARINDIAHLVISLDDVADHGRTILDGIAILVHEHIALVNLLSHSRPCQHGEAKQ